MICEPYVSFRGFVVYTHLVAVKFQENFKTPPNMKRNVAVRLKHLSSNGPLVKVTHTTTFDSSFHDTSSYSQHYQVLTHVA